MCNSDKVRNITRKVKAVMGDEYDQDDFNELVDLYVDSYIKGLEIMKVLRESYAEIYDDIFSLETTYKRQVKIKTMMNSNRSLNADIFKEILEDFEKQLKEVCRYFAIPSILELKVDIISMWLADCSMQFRK